MKPKFSPDFWVQLGILLLSGIMALGGTIAFCFMNFATKDEVAIEREERREMKAEVDTLYSIQVPESQRKPLEHHHYIGEKGKDHASSQ